MIFQGTTHTAIRKELGKIEKVTFGMGGYQDSMFGVSFTFSGEGWGIGTFKGTWSFPPSERAKWTLDDQTKEWAEMIRLLVILMNQAKVNEIHELEGVPVEVEIENSTLKSWRILKEVL